MHVEEYMSICEVIVSSEFALTRVAKARDRSFTGEA